MIAVNKSFDRGTPGGMLNAIPLVMCTYFAWRDKLWLRTSNFLLLFALLTPSLIGYAQADLVPGLGDLERDMNSAVKFNPSVRTLVTVAYRDPNLPLSRFIQLGFSTDSNIDFSILGLQWSKDNLNFFSFTPTDSIYGIASGSGTRYSDIIDLGTHGGGTSSATFYLRYIIPAGLMAGTKIQSVFLANSNGSHSNGVLTDQIDNHFVSLTRLHTAIPEPSSLLLLLVVVTLGILRFRALERVKRTFIRTLYLRNIFRPANRKPT